MQKLISIISCVVIVYYFSCSPSPKFSSKAINNARGLIVTRFYPLFDEDGNFLKNDTSIATIFFFEDKIIYNDTVDIVSSQSFLQNEIVKNDRKQMFFCVTNRSNIGYLFSDSANILCNKCITPMLADSFLKNQWYYEFSFKPSRLTILSDQNDDKHGVLMREYYVKEKIDTSIQGKLSLEFSKAFGDIPYSLNKQLDTVKQMKLSKMQLLVNIQKMANYFGKIQTMYLSYSLTPIETPIPEKIMNSLRHMPENMK